MNADKQFTAFNARRVLSSGQGGYRSQSGLRMSALQVRKTRTCIKLENDIISKKRKGNSNYGFLSVFCVIGNFLFPITQKTLREDAHFAEKKQMLRIPLKR